MKRLVSINGTSLSAPQDVDRWSFDVFALNSASSDRALQIVFYELIARYGLNGRFKVFIYDFWRQTDKQTDR